MPAGVTIKQKRKAGAFTAGQLAAGEIGVNTSAVRLEFSADGSTVTPVVGSVGLLRTVLTTDSVNNNATANTLQDVTGLSFAVAAGVVYEFEFVLTYDAAATTTGARFSINGPAFTALGYHTTYTAAAAAGSAVASVTHYTGYNLPSAAGTFTPYAAHNLCTIRGVIEPSAAGTVIARVASEVASSAITVKARRSYVEYSAL